MSLDLAAVRLAIVAGLPKSLGLTAHAHLSGAKSLPFAVLGNVERVAFTKDYGGTASVEIPLWVMVSRSNDEAAQAALDSHVSIGGPKSVYSALRLLTQAEDAPWRSLTVLSTGPYGSTEFNTAAALAVAFNLSITA